MDGFFDFIGNLIKTPFICMGWFFVAFLAGGLARYFMKSKDYPFFSDILLGFGGALVGGIVSGGLLNYDPNTSGLELVIINLIIATLGAMGLIFLGRRFGR